MQQLDYWSKIQSTKENKPSVRWRKKWVRWRKAGGCFYFMYAQHEMMPINLWTFQTSIHRQVIKQQRCKSTKSLWTEETLSNVNESNVSATKKKPNGNARIKCEHMKEPSKIKENQIENKLWILYVCSNLYNGLSKVR